MRIIKLYSRLISTKFVVQKADSPLNQMSFVKYSNDVITSSSYNWDVKAVIHTQTRRENEKYSFVILNTPILNPELVLSLWKNAALRFAVDGGCNQLHDILKKLKINELNGFLPHIVSGDFDSVHNDILQFYQQQNVKIIHTPDQDKTDFHKALEILSTFKQGNVIVYGDNSGRLDHIMGNINTLYVASNYAQLKHLNLHLLGNDCLTWLLQPGHHSIQIPKNVWSEKSYCSLIPIGKPCCHVSTTGLKWNLNNSRLEFGGSVSTSNTYDISQAETIVTVNTDSTLLWSMTINENVLEE